MAFSTPSAAGHDVSLSSKHTKITTDNRAEYIRLALNYRFLPHFMLFSGFGKFYKALKNYRRTWGPITPQLLRLHKLIFKLWVVLYQAATFTHMTGATISIAM